MPEVHRQHGVWACHQHRLPQHHVSPGVISGERLLDLRGFYGTRSLTLMGGGGGGGCVMVSTWHARTLFSQMFSSCFLYFFKVPIYMYIYILALSWGQSVTMQHVLYCGCTLCVWVRPYTWCCIECSWSYVDVCYFLNFAFSLSLNWQLSKCSFTLAFTALSTPSITRRPTGPRSSIIHGFRLHTYVRGGVDTRVWRRRDGGRGKKESFYKRQHLETFNTHNRVQLQFDHANKCSWSVHNSMSTAKWCKIA